MTVTVFIPSVLRNECGGATSIDLEPGEAVSLTRVLDEVAASYPRLDRRIRDERGRLRQFVNVFVNQEESRALAGMDTAVPDGAEVRIIPSVAGG